MSTNDSHAPRQNVVSADPRLNATLDDYIDYYDYQDIRWGSNDDLVDASHHFIEASLPAKIILGIVYVGMMLICGLGTLIICYTLVKFRKMRSVVNLLLTNLAISDFFVAVISAPFFMDYYMRGSWIFGKGVCKLAGYVKNTSLLVSINCLLVISVDRLVITAYPMKRRMTICKAAMIAATVWITSATIALPTALYSTVVDTVLFKPKLRRVSFCLEVWPHDSNFDVRTYGVMLLVGEFVVPVLVMGVCYFLICRKLWLRVMPGVVTPEQARQDLERKRRTTRMLIIVVCLFVACWSPYYAHGIYRDYFNARWKLNKQRMNLHFIVEAVAMTSSAANAVIYIFMNRNIRQCLLTLVNKVGPLTACCKENQRGQNLRSSKLLSTRPQNPPKNSDTDDQANPPEEEFSMIENVEELTKSRDSPTALPPPNGLSQTRIRASNVEDVRIRRGSTHL